MASSRSRTAIIVVTMAVAPACGTVYDYPTAEAETTAAACHDGEDNDFDGMTDCADPDCTPQCPEHDEVSCADGTDNDLDGRADCRDFGCAVWCLPPMVQMPSGAWLDPTEVTRGQYEAWVASQPSLVSQPVQCVWNTSFVPSPACEATSPDGPGSQDHPQACVDWCDAQAYCQAVGKQLCGRPEGDPAWPGGFDDAAKSQWFDACSAGGTVLFVYGNTHEGGACNDADRGEGGTIAVGTATNCDSVAAPYSGVFDLHGNVAEWEDSCDDQAKWDTPCRLRGGGFRSQQPACGFDESAPRDTVRDDVGFRCCRARQQDPETSRQACSDGLDNDRDGTVDCGDDGCADFCCGASGLPLMVRLPKGYCIDATEVTRTQYAAWLKTDPSVDGQRPECAWNESFTPECLNESAMWPPRSHGSLPVSCVDWCDAVAYCEGVGKRLCGAIGGGSNNYSSPSDPNKSQWFDACSSGGLHQFSYGEGLQEQTCNVQETYNEDVGCTGCMAMPVGSLPGCQSPESEYAGVFDLTGNVEEWEDACQSKVGRDDLCRKRGGAFSSDITSVRCNWTQIVAARWVTSTSLGFRCCSR